MTLRSRLLSAIIFACAATASPAAASELIVNGNFENIGFGGTTTNYNLGPNAENPIPADFGFDVTNGNVDIIANGRYSSFFANGGAYNLDLIGYNTNTATINQNIYTVAGKIYRVNIDYSENEYLNGGTAFVSFGASMLTTLDETHIWQHYSTTIVGTGTAQDFSIVSGVSGPNHGVHLDNISVSDVPEPVTWSLFVSGFGMIGAGLRRRTWIATI